MSGAADAAPASARERRVRLASIPRTCGCSPNLRLSARPSGATSPGTGPPPWDSAGLPSRGLTPAKRTRGGEPWKNSEAMKARRGPPRSSAFTASCPPAPRSMDLAAPSGPRMRGCSRVIRSPRRSRVRSASEGRPASRSCSRPPRSSPSLARRCARRWSRTCAAATASRGSSSPSSSARSSASTSWTASGRRAPTSSCRPPPTWPPGRRPRSSGAGSSSSAPPSSPAPA